MIYFIITQNFNPKFVLFCLEKITKSDIFGRFENDYSDLHFCYFCVDQNIKYLKSIFYAFVKYNIDYIQIYFQNFWKLKNMNFFINF
jgi:hypothetical protein